MRPITGPAPVSSPGTAKGQQNRNCIGAAAGLNSEIGMPRNFKPKAEYTPNDFSDEIRRNLDPSGGELDCRIVSCSHILRNQERDGKLVRVSDAGAKETPCDCKEREIVIFPYADKDGKPDVHAVGRNAPCNTYVPYESNVSGTNIGDITSPIDHLKKFIQPTKIFFDGIICYCCKPKRAK